MVGHADIETEQGHKRTQQTLGLPPRTTKGQAQQVPGLDRQVRIVARTTALARVGRMPGRQRLGRHPDRQAAALLERLVVLRLVGDLVARPQDRVAGRLIGLVGHQSSGRTREQPYAPATHAAKAYKLRITHQRQYKAH